jgi:hypothetical protein
LNEIGLGSDEFVGFFRSKKNFKNEQGVTGIQIKIIPYQDTEFWKQSKH